MEITGCHFCYCHLFTIGHVKLIEVIFYRNNGTGNFLINFILSGKDISKTILCKMFWISSLILHYIFSNVKLFYNPFDTSTTCICTSVFIYLYGLWSVKASMFHLLCINNHIVQLYEVLF